MEADVANYAGADGMHRYEQFAAVNAAAVAANHAYENQFTQLRFPELHPWLLVPQPVAQLFQFPGQAGMRQATPDLLWLQDDRQGQERHAVIVGQSGRATNIFGDGSSNDTLGSGNKSVSGNPQNGNVGLDLDDQFMMEVW